MTGFHIETDRRTLHRPLLWAIIVLIILFFVWAGSFQVEQHVRATGRIIPAGYAKTVQHLEGGIVSAINVQEGQSVKAGDVLLQVTNQRAFSDLEEQKIALQALQVRLARLKAEYQGQEQFDFSVPGAGTNAETSKMAEIIESETRLFVSRRQDQAEKINVLQEQARQKSLRLEDLSAQLVNLRAERAVAQEQLDINEKLRRSGAISESRYLDTKSRVKSFDTRIDQVQKSIPITRAELAEVEKKKVSVRESFGAEVTNEITQIELGIQKLTERIKAGYDEVERTAVLAPTAGIVNKLHVNTEGGVVQPGAPLVEIIPLEDNLVVEAKLLTKDRGLVWHGLPAMVKVSAYDFALYGGVKGTVADVSADSFAEDNGVPYYRMRVVLESNKMPDQSPLYPGMTVDVNVISGEITILHALLKRFWQVQENALREP